MKKNSQYVSTRGDSLSASLEEAIINGLASDEGLYIPAEFPILDNAFISELSRTSLETQDIAEEILGPYLLNSFSKAEITSIVEEAFNFKIPLKEYTSHHAILELFHGPTLAFKDFGARFMARVMSAFWEKIGDEALHILVATSGDTGGAVAHGFYRVPGIKVSILYPEGMVSELQEAQLTSLGDNISTLKVQGTFDDCQKLVKSAFSDIELREKKHLSSANSINIARLLPQMLYYFVGYQQATSLFSDSTTISFCIPSGNFGNLCAGVFAKKMGLPVSTFIAGCNLNSPVPAFLSGAAYVTNTGIPTLSNAMDVGSPSNFERLNYLFNNERDTFKKYMEAYTISEEETKHRLNATYADTTYIACPHTAVGLEAALKSKRSNVVTLATAHPAKFKNVVDNILNIDLPLPKELSESLQHASVAKTLSNSYDEFRAYLENV